MADLDDKIDLLRRQIEDAFAKRSYPGDTSLGHGASDCDIERNELATALQGHRWQDLSVQFLRSHQSGVYLLPPEAYRYYLPAYIIACVVHLAEADVLPDAVLGSLMHPSEQSGAYRPGPFHARMDGFGSAERSAIKLFLEYMINERSVADGPPDPSAETIRYWELSVPGDEWRAAVGSEERAACLRRQIEGAFADRTYPGDEHLIDDPSGGDLECQRIEAAFRGKQRNEVSLDSLRLNASSLYFFSPEAYRYYLPAYLTAAMVHYAETEALPYTVVSCLVPPGKDTRRDQRRWFYDRIHPLRGKEQRAISSFLEYMTVEHPDGLPPEVSSRAFKRFWRLTKRGRA